LVLERGTLGFGATGDFDPKSRAPFTAIGGPASAGQGADHLDAPPCGDFVRGLQDALERMFEGVSKC
jgi:hypothetical protein